MQTTRVEIINHRVARNLLEDTKPEQTRFFQTPFFLVNFGGDPVYINDKE